MAPFTLTPENFRALAETLRAYLPDLTIQPETGREADGFLVGAAAETDPERMETVALTGWRAPGSEDAARAAIIAGYVRARQRHAGQGSAPVLDEVPELAPYRNTAFSDGARLTGLPLSEVFDALREGTGAKEHAATVADALARPAAGSLGELAVAVAGLDLSAVPGQPPAAREALTLGLVGLADVQRLNAAVPVLVGPVAARIPDSARAGLYTLLAWVSWMGGREADVQRFAALGRDWWTLPEGEDLPLVSPVPAWRVAPAR